MKRDHLTFGNSTITFCGIDLSKTKARELREDEINPNKFCGNCIRTHKFRKCEYYDLQRIKSTY